MKTSCNNGDVRLVGGINELDGQVEICYNKIWGSVCHNFWNTYDANVVCKQLRYQYTGKYFIKQWYFKMKKNKIFVLKMQKQYNIVILVLVIHLIFFLMLDVPHMGVISLSYNALTKSDTKSSYLYNEMH